MSSQETIALQLFTLAQDEAGRSLLLQQSACLTGLVALLNADHDEKVLNLSLQALELLSKASAHHATLVNQPGLIVALTMLTDKPSITIKTLAQNVLTSLENYVNGTTAGNGSTPSTARRTPMTSRAGSRGNTRPTTPSGGRENGTGVLKAFAPSYLNNVIFNITSTNGPLDKLAQGEVEKALVSIKGIISVTFAAATGNFTLYTSHRPPVLAPLVTKAITDLRGGYSATLMSKDVKNDGADKENQENEAPKQPSAAPSYLNAKAGPSYLNKNAINKAPASSSSSSGSAPGYLNAGNVGGATNASGSRALTTHTTATSQQDSAQSLAAATRKKLQVAQQQAKQAEAPKKGLLSSVTSFFW